MSRPAALCVVLVSALVLSSCAVPPARQTTASLPAPAPATQAKAPLPSASPAPAPVAAAPVIPPSSPEPEVAQVPEPVVPPTPVDKGEALRTWVDQQSRLYRVAAPLLINNTELCPQHARSILGFTAKNRYSFSSQYIDAAQSSLGLGEELRIMDVLPGSGAEQAGVRKGDVLVAIEIEPAPQGPDAEHVAAALIGEEMQGRDALHLTFRRDGERMAFDVPLTPACAIVLDLGNTDDAHSFSDGRRVMVTRGLLNFAQSDEELAYAIAREVARNEIAPDTGIAMKELIDRLHAIDAAESSGDTLPAVKVSYSESDDNADKLALYLLARAGYGIDGFEPFLQRLESATESHTSGNSSIIASTRMATLDQTIREVKTKKNGGLPLIP